MKQLWGLVFTIALFAIGCSGASSDSPGEDLPAGPEDALEIDESASDEAGEDAPD